MPTAHRVHRGWYSRGYLPHLDEPNLIQSITYRLYDSMPTERCLEWEPLLRLADSAQHRERLQAYLDAGHGSCLLRDPRLAALVQQALLHFDGQRYCLLGWVVMPNHVHVLIQALEGHPLASVVHTWKSYTAKRANQILGRSGPFWHRDYFDRYIRHTRHLQRAIDYVHDNPVKAGLVEHAEEWPFSSAYGSVGVSSALYEQ